MSVKLSTEDQHLVDGVYEGLQGAAYPPEVVEGRLDIPAAYRIQWGVLERHQQAGRQVGGWKTGKAPGALATALGENTQLTAPLFTDGFRQSPCEIPHDIPGLIIEVEVDLILGEALQGPGITAERARAVVAGITPCFEIVGGQLPDFKSAGMPGFLAAGMGNWGVVTGPVLEPVPANLDTSTLHAELWLDGKRLPDNPRLGAPVCPFQVLADFANQLAGMERRIEAGQHVITGARAIQMRCAPGKYEGRVNQLGSVSMTIC